MKTDDIRIVDRGRGPQLSTSRVTVLDVFYYLHRGYEFETIQEIMPDLSLHEFNVVIDYVHDHKDELADLDRRAEFAIQRGIAEQTAKNLVPPIDETTPLEQRIARLKKKLIVRGTNGAGIPG